MSKKIMLKKEDSFLRELLTPEAYDVLRNKGTERAFSGKYVNYKVSGNYLCSGCGESLFNSNAKFDSGTGWPSFFEPINKENLIIEKDFSFGMVRMEVMCSNCGSHLGHLFEDGPEPTGLRYCINSISLKHKIDEK